MQELPDDAVVAHHHDLHSQSAPVMRHSRYLPSSLRTVLLKDAIDEVSEAASMANRLLSTPKGRAGHCDPSPSSDDELDHAQYSPRSNCSTADSHQRNLDPLIAEVAASKAKIELLLRRLREQEIQVDEKDDKIQGLNDKISDLEMKLHVDSAKNEIRVVMASETATKAQEEAELWRNRTHVAERENASLQNANLHLKGQLDDAKARISDLEARLHSDASEAEKKSEKFIEKVSNLEKQLKSSEQALERATHQQDLQTSKHESEKLSMEHTIEYLRSKLKATEISLEEAQRKQQQQATPSALPQTLLPSKPKSNVKFYMQLLFMVACVLILLLTNDWHAELRHSYHGF